MSLLPEISQASTEINKLVAQANIHQTIAPVNPAAFTDPADTALLASRDPVIRDVSVGMTGDGYSDYSVSGTPPLSMPNSLGKPLKAWSVDLLPYQEGSGDPAPDNVRPIHGTDKVTITTAGENLCDVATTEFKKWRLDSNVFKTMPDSFSSITYSVSDQSVTITNNANYVGIGFTIDAVQYERTFSIPQSLGGSVQFWSAYEDGATRISTGSTSCAIPANTSGFVALRVDTAGTRTTVMQLEFGTTATPYTPYLAPSQTVITLPSTVYTATIGESGGESRDAIIDMGDMTWDRVGANGRFYSTSIRSLVKWGSDAEGYNNAFAETYKAENVASLSFLSDNCMSVDSAGNLQLYDSSKAGMTGTDLKTALTGIKMVYKLATLVQFALSTQDIPTPRGDATTLVVAEDGAVDSMSVTYAGKA